MIPICNTLHGNVKRVKAVYAEVFDDFGRLTTEVHMLEPPIELSSGDSLTITWTIKVE